LNDKQLVNIYIKIVYSKIDYLNKEEGTTGNSSPVICGTTTSRMGRPILFLSHDFNGRG
jgi:hypothetical protein